MNQTPRYSIRQGITVLETTGALAVVTAAALALTQLVGAVAKQRRATYARQMAIVEVANEAERVAIAAWEEMAPEKFTGWKLSDDLLTVLPSAKGSAVVSEEEGQPGGRRVRLQVRWANASGQDVEPVALTVWKFQTEAAP